MKWIFWLEARQRNEINKKEGEKGKFGENQ